MKFRDSIVDTGIVVLLLSLTFVPGCSDDRPDKGKGPAAGKEEAAGERICRAGDVAVIDMYLTTADRMATGAAYCTLANRGTEADSLLSVSTPVTPDVEIHEMAEDGGMMTMRKLGGALPIGANASVELSPSGTHIMLINVDRQLKNGDSVELELRFARAGTIRCTGIVGRKPQRTEGSDAADMGAQVYNTYCKTCHQADGKGVENVFPPLAGSDYLKNKEQTIDAIVNGLQGRIAVNGVEYVGVMPPLAPTYDDEQAAAVINYVMKTFGDGSWSTTSAEVGRIRNK